MPRFEQFMGELWSGVLTQFVIRAPQEAQAEGLVVAYDYDPVNLHVKMGVIVLNRGLGIGYQASILFVNHLFSTWPIQKVYFEVPDFNLDRLGSMLSKHASHEGTLRDHLFNAGSWYDQQIWSIARGEQSDRVSALAAGLGRS